MSGGIALLELALLDVVVDSLTVNSRPVPLPENVSRVQMPPAVQCCPGDGVLYAYWSKVYPDRQGMPTGMGAPIGRNKVDVYACLYRCYPTLGDNGEFPEGLDAAAEGLALDADALYYGISQAICGKMFDPYTNGCDQVTLVDIVPRSPAGGCAGLTVHLTVGFMPWAPGT